MRRSTHQGATDQAVLPRGVICLAVYKPKPDLLRIQLESLQRQTLQSWTCVIGIDGPDAVAKSMVEELTAGDARFAVREFPENVGFYANFERLIVEALGQRDCAWIALADQDDRWYPSKLRVLVDRLHADPQVSLVFGQANVVAEDGRSLGVTNRRVPTTVQLLLNNSVTGSFCVFAAEKMRGCIPFPLPTAAAYHDHWLGVYAATVGRLAAVDVALQDYVQHQGNVTGEEQRHSVRKRWGRMASTSIAGRVRIVRDERWQWRRNMAERLTSLPANPTAKTSGRSVFEKIASGSTSPRVILTILRSAVSGANPWSRALSQVFAVLLSRRGTA